MTSRKHVRAVRESSVAARLPSARRKNVWISQAKLDTAKDELGVATETEAIDLALDLVVFQHEARRGLKAMAGRGGFVSESER